MNVAEDIADSRLIELNQPSTTCFVQSEVESLAFKERKYIVKERIVIGEFHG